MNPPQLDPRWGKISKIEYRCIAIFKPNITVDNQENVLTWFKSNSSDKYYSVPLFRKCLFNYKQERHLLTAAAIQSTSHSKDKDTQQLCSCNVTTAVAQRKERTENGSYLGSLPLPVPPCSSAESVLLFTTPASESGGDKRGGKKGEAGGECVCVCAYERESRAVRVDTARPQLSKDSAPPSFFFCPPLF